MEVGRQRSMKGCGECGTALAHDQRYCLSCGARRGPLPSYVTQAIARAHEQGAVELLPRPPIAHPDTEDATDTGPFDAWLVAPRAAAVAVMGMLGFGVVVGSLVGESAASGGAPVIVAESPNSAWGAAAARPGGGGGGSGTGGSGGGGTQTITVGSTTPVGGSAPPVQAQSPMMTTSSTATTPLNTGLPPIKHVFLVLLSGQGYNPGFAHDPYFAITLAAKAEEVLNYYSVAGGSLANEIALVSGQGPTPDTVNDCPVYRDMMPGKRGARGQFLGNGCVYPKRTQTLPAELEAAHLGWKAFVQLKTTGKRAQLQACSHPRLGGQEPQPTSQDPYAAWRNPFLYFQSLTPPATCAKHDVPLRELSSDLRDASTAPALSYLIPDLCDDGSPTPCGPGAPAGLSPADAFLKAVLPEIEHSAAYKAGGLIAITFDQAPQSGPNADSSSCCDNPTYPNMPSSPSPPATSTTPTTTAATTTTGTTGTTTTTTTTTTSTGTDATGTTTTTSASPPGSSTFGSGNPTGGGGQVGLVLISQYVKPGTQDAIDSFNHFSLLASIESLFGLKRIAYAGDPLLPVFGTSVYTKWAG